MHAIVRRCSQVAVLPLPARPALCGDPGADRGRRCLGGVKWFSSTYTCIDVEGPPTLSGWLGHDRPSLWVSTAQVSWLGAGTVCNWKMELRWTDVNGHVYRTDSSRVHVGCSAGRAVYGRNFGHQVYSSIYLSGMKMRTGRACGYLYECGALRPGVPCESIH